MLVLMLPLVPLGPLAGQQVAPATLTGVLRDAGGVPVMDAEVTLAAPGRGQLRALSDRSGVFRFEGVPPGEYHIRIQRLGFIDIDREVRLGAGEVRAVDVDLQTAPVRLADVVAEGRWQSDRERARFDSDPGVTARVVEGRSLKVLPGLGEPDVLRAVELLPGVISTSDFSSTFNVRGGAADQNLILIDGFTVFNPFHLGGLFSVFNSDAVERAELFAGGFGAEFGGRVSSVLNVESRSDLPEALEVVGGVSLLATRILARAPLPRGVSGLLGGGGGGWFVSARRSYFDQLLRPVTDFPYHLTDLQAHAALQTRGGGRLTFTAYTGDDILDLSNSGLADDGSAASVLRLRWNWGNRVLGTRWVQPLPAGWVVDSRAGYSRFAERLAFLDFGDVRFGSRIEQVVFRADLSRDFDSALSARFGLAADAVKHRNLAEAGGTTFFASEGDGVLTSGYGSVRWRPASRWLIEPGLRLDLWHASDTTRTVVSPRFAAKRFLGADQNIALKLAVGRYSQFIHSLRDEELPVSNDTWILSDRAVPHVVSDQFQAGAESFWGDGWFASAEAYLRTFSGITDFNYAEDPNDPDDDLLSGEGISYGVDLLLRRAHGRWSGWGALSLLRAERTFPDPAAAGWDDLPQKITFPPIYDRRANLDLVAQYATPAGLEVGARWNFGTGLPYSRPLAQYFAWRHNPVRGRAEPLDFGPDRGGIPVAVVIGERNAERYPPYHRLDLTVRRTFERRWGSYVPYLQVLNVYNRRNVLFYFYDYNRAPPVRSGFSMFPILPALGVEVSF